WDWLAPLAAVVTFFKIVTQWWGWFEAEPFSKRLTFEMYVGVLVSAVLLFLLAAAALPDPIEKGGRVGLARHYRRIVRRYWLIFAAHLLVSFAVSIWVQMTIKNGGANPLSFSPYFLLIPGAIALAFVRIRLLHGLALLALLGLYFSQLLGHT